MTCTFLSDYIQDNFNCNKCSTLTAHRHLNLFHASYVDQLWLNHQLWFNCLILWGGSLEILTHCKHRWLFHQCHFWEWVYILINKCTFQSIWLTCSVHLEPWKWGCTTVLCRIWIPRNLLVSTIFPLSITEWASPQQTTHPRYSTDLSNLQLNKLHNAVVDH